MFSIFGHQPINRDEYKNDALREPLVKPTLKAPISTHTVNSVRELNETLKKILAVAIIAPLLCGIFIPVIFPQKGFDGGRVHTSNNGLITVPPYLQPYSNQIQLAAIPQPLSPIKKFPPYLHKVMYPGLMSGGNGRMCEIPENMPPFHECERISSLIEDQLEHEKSSEYRNIISTPDISNHKGVELETNSDFGDQIDRITVGMDYRKFSNYQEAISFVEQAVLNDQDFFGMNTKLLFETIIKTNAFITQKLFNNPGEIRNQISLVLDEKTEISRKGLLEAFNRHGGTSKDRKHFNTLYKKLERYDTVDATLIHLTPAERRVLNIIGYVTCPPKEIEGKMYNVAKQIQELAVAVKNQTDSSIEKVTIGMDQGKVTNYQNALTYVENTILNDETFFENDELTLVETIKKTNQFVTQQLSETSSTFRTEYMIILDDKTDKDHQGLQEAVKRRGGTSADLKHLQSFLNKMNKYGSFETAHDHLSKNELRVLNMIGFVPCPPQEVEDKMIKFAQQIKELAAKVKNQEVATVAAAAYVHQEMGKIHPFDDGNGRTARIWMNVMLQFGGFKAIAFPSEEKYTEAVIKDQKSPGTFISYLEKVIEWNCKQKTLS